MSFFSSQISAFVWGSSIFHNSKGQDCRSLDFFKDSEREFTVAGVYDGHGLADYASMYASEYLPAICAKACSSTLKNPENRESPKRELAVATALATAVLSADAKYAEVDPPTASSRSGSTICMAIEVGSELFFVNTGDSRAMVGNFRAVGTPTRIGAVGTGAVRRVPRLNALHGVEPAYVDESFTNASPFEQATVDHCASANAKEISRCKLAGATISNGRLFPETCLHWWSFMLTRTFGNTFSKGKAMIANPDIYRKPIQYEGKELERLLDSSKQLSSPQRGAGEGPTYVKGQSAYYDLSRGTVGEGVVDPVDYVILGSDGVWAAISNQEVHAIIADSVQRYQSTKDVQYMNPCLIAARITRLCMERVRRDDLYADDVTVVLGLRRQSLFPRGTEYEMTASLKQLDAWYHDIQEQFKSYYKNLAAQGGANYNNLLRLLYTMAGAADNNPQNKFRYILDIDRIIKDLHTNYKRLKGGQNPVPLKAERPAG